MVAGEHAGTLSSAFTASVSGLLSCGEYGVHWTVD